MVIELGRTYKDKISGFKGVCTGHVEYLTGCNQTLLIPAAGRQNKADGVWFDDQRMVACCDKKIVLDNSNTPGCDISAPIR